MPITEDEAMRILHQVKEGVERPKPMVTFEIGEQVRVADRPVRLLQRSCRGGRTSSAPGSRWRCLIFGRPTPVELEFGSGREGRLSGGETRGQRATAGRE